MARIDNGLTQEIAADENQERDEETATSLTCGLVFAKKLGCLEKPRECETSAKDYAPERLTLFTGVSTNQWTGRTPRAAQKGE